MESPLGWRRGGNLPYELTSFVGRNEHLVRLNELLMTSRLVSVIGPGGVGKTRIAIRAANEHRDQHPDGIWKIDLSDVREAAVLPHVLMTSMGLRDSSNRSEIEYLHATLRDKKMLIMLDTCEHLVDACAALVETFMVHKGVNFLVTSRQPLGLDAEHRLLLPPLEENDAVLLFLDRAALVMPDSEPDLRIVSEIVRHLDCIPLAIELAAGRLPALSAEQILSLLGDRFRLLRRDLKSKGPIRHRALRATLGWSHELCEPAERLLWARLTVFTGTFDLAAAKFICSSDELPESTLAATLHQLVDKSILTILPGTDRYRMLDTIKAYGAERLAELDETSWLMARYCSYYHDMARRAEHGWNHGSRQVYWYVQIMREHSHIRAVIEYYLADPAASERCLDLTAALWFLWHGCGLSREGGHYLDRALAVSRRPSRERCKALWVRAFVACTQGDVEIMDANALRCAQESALIGDADAMVYATNMTGLAAFLSGDFPKALAYLGSAVKSFRAESGLNPGLLPALAELGSCLVSTGQPEEAEELMMECMEMCEEAGEVWIRSYAYWVLAEANRELGRYTKAITATHEGMRIKRDLHDVGGILLCLEMLAWLHADLETEEAAKDAAFLFGATGIGWAKFGVLPYFGSPVWQDQSAQAQEKAKLILGAEIFKEIAAKGAEHGVEEVMEMNLH